MAMGNNPMMMVDTDGEWVWAPIIIGALIGAGGYTASVAFSDGGFDNWNWGQFAASVGIGAVSGVITPGLGEAFGGFGGNASTFGGKILNEIARATVHGHVNGVLSAVSGGSYQSGFASGGLGSVGGSVFQSVGGNFANSGVGTVAFSAAAGGIGAELSGGDFWRGAATGAIVGLLNHSLHEVSENQARKQAIKARYSGNYNLKQLKNIIDGVGYAAGYGSGVAGFAQIGLLAHRNALPILSRVGTFPAFRSAYRGLGGTSRILGGAGYLLGGVGIGFDYQLMQRGEIGLGRFGYRMGSYGASIATGALIGWRFGRHYGAMGGAFIGGVFAFGEMLYDAGNYLSTEINRQIYNFKQGLGHGWYPGR